MEFRSSRRRAALLPVLSLAAFASAWAAFTPVRSAVDPVERLDHAAIQWPGLRLPGPVRGAAAVRLLGPRLNEIAARYGETGDSLAATLLRDRDLWLDDQSRLTYSCTFRFAPRRFAFPQNGALPQAGIEGAPFPLDKTFELHSLPASKRVIYLDFDGHLTRGTDWNSGIGDIQSLPWSLDANRANFTSKELTAIQEIWQSVAEDFAPLDIDVTTEEPDLERLRRTSAGDEFFGIRVVISPTNSFNPNTGGVAKRGSFTWDSDTPCYVFVDNIANLPSNIGEAASHEAGHSLGLRHDGVGSTEEYYEGHGDWAPIMGSAYGQPISQFSKGEYANANNPEDDFAKMAEFGGSERLDDAGNTPAEATAIPLNVTGGGIISSRTDADVFSFYAFGGVATLSAAPAPHLPNLNIKLGLYNAQGQLIVEAAGNTLAQEIKRSLTPGSYFVRVDGKGFGNPATTGYSDYGSVGQYVLRVSAAPLTVAKLKFKPKSVRAGAATVGTVTLSAPSGPGATTVALASSKPEAAPVPPSVVVPAGATSATFDVTTNTVRKRTAVKVSATVGTSTKTGRLTVR